MKVLLIVIDAASPRVLCPAVQTNRLRNLKLLADAGEMHQGSATIFPSITPAATTSIITGTYPFEHGIAGAAWYDKARQDIAYYGDDFWTIAREGFRAFLEDFLLRLNGDRLTAPTMFELVERAGRKAACLNYLVYRGLVRHRVNVPWLLALLPGVPITEYVDGPSLLCLGDFVTAKSHSHRHIHEKGGVLHRFGMDDASTAVMLAELAADPVRPDFTVAYFADNDYRSHEVGPVAALPVLDRVDDALGRMFDASGGFDRFMRDTCVIVTSDHGHSEVLRGRREAIVQLDRLLDDFRQADLAKPWKDGDEILICPNMRAAQIYMRQPSEVMVDRIVRDVLKDERVDLTIWRRDIAGGREPGYSVMGPAGRLDFWRDANGSLMDGVGGTWGWRGDLDVLHLERDGRIVTSAEYPNAFERIAGVLDSPDSGEIWVTVRPGCEFGVPGGGESHVAGGSHGALHALDSLCPVIVAGAPRRLPKAMRSVDIAPLAMEAMGLPMRYEVGEPRSGSPFKVTT